MTVDEAASALGLSRATVYEKLRTKEIPGGIRVGRRILVSVDALTRYASAEITAPK